MSIKDKRISSFETTHSTQTEPSVNTIESVLENIKKGRWRLPIELLRDGDETIKAKLPMLAMHGSFEGFRKKNDFYESTGLIILDLDDVILEDIEETKQDIFDEYESVLAVMTSPSGTGIKILYLVDEELVTAETYKLIGRKVVEDFEQYGDVDYLSITDCLIATYDPNILINYDAIAASVFIDLAPIEKKELPELDLTRVLWDDVEDFFETVLAEDIASKTNNNFHYIQVAILDLKKFGFEHPEHDLEFVIHYAEEEFKTSPKNKARFHEVVEIAKSYHQTTWAYKMIREEEETEQNDYSKYNKEPKGIESSEDTKEEEEEKEESAFIDYDTFWEKVVGIIEEGPRVGFETSHQKFADTFRFRGTGILTVTGIPGHGKTEKVDSWLVDLARLYGHESIIAGFEQSPEEHVVKLIRKLLGVNVTCPTWFKEENKDVLKEAYNYITSVVTHIDTTKTGGNINTILDACAEKIHEKREAGRDPKYVVFDPFNMLSVKGKFSGHEKIEEILRRLTHFSHQMNVMVILVAHPFKMKIDEKSGDYLVPDFYSVKGSSAFFEMSYHGIVVYRPSYGTNVMVRILKVKQNNLGFAGAASYYDYQKASGRYIPTDEAGAELAGDHFHKDWLEKALVVLKEKLSL